MVPETFGRYKIEAELGRGGMGVVYQANDPRFGRKVAIKVLPAAMLYDPDLGQRFVDEARTIAALEHHAVVPVYDFGQEQGQPVMVMRLMEGGSLADRLEHGAMALAQARAVMGRVCAALGFIHDQGVVHRDVKPQNILFDKAGDAFLSDFGIARALDLSGTVSIAGTPAYMSPEQAEGKPSLDHRADIYALGAVLFEMLTGKRPYRGATPLRVMLMHLSDPVPSLSDLIPPPEHDVRSLDGVVSRAMSKDPAARFESAQAMWRAIAAQSSTSAPTVTVESGRLGEIFALAWKPDNTALVCGKGDGLLAHWTTDRWQERQLKAHAGPVLSVQWSLDGRRLVTCGDDLLVRLWNEGLKLQHTFGPTLTQPYGVAISPDARLVACGTFRGELWVWSSKTGQAVHQSRDSPTVMGLDFSPTGRHLAVAHIPDRVFIHDTEGFAQERYLKIERRSLNDSFLRRLSFDPTGRHLATAGFDGVVRVWDTEQWAPPKVLDGQRVCFSDVSFDPTGQRLAVGTSKGTVQIWDVPRWRVERELAGHSGRVKTVAFDRTGQRLASGGQDATVRIWDVGPQSPQVGQCLRTLQ